MPAVNTPRPTLRSFRVLALSGKNKGEAAGAKMHLTVRQEIEVGLAVPSTPDAPLMVGVVIKLDAAATNDVNTSDVATCSAEYEARFIYAPGLQEAAANALLDDRDYQYALVAQAFPLAMTHFRRELQAMGLDARELPLGLVYD